MNAPLPARPHWREGLDEQQLAALVAPVGPLAILAGPGSGKTRTLIARIGAMGDLVGNSNVAAFSHTTKAAGEMRERLGRTQLGACSTIHAAAWRLLRVHWQHFGALADLAPNVYGLVKQAAVNVLGDVAAETVADLIAEIDASRAAGLDENTWKTPTGGRGIALAPAAVHDVWHEFTALKAHANLWDFADVLARATTMAEAGVGGWQAVFVDEYQDIDPAQEKLVRLWAPDRNISVVGDVDQAIFGFKGGDSRFLTRFREQWPDATVVELTNNYRSATTIVSWTSRLSTRAAQLTSTRPEPGDCRVASAANEADEERQLAAGLRAWHDSGVNWDDMAVLYRFNALGARVEAALGNAGIPYRVEKGEKFFDRADVRSVLVPFGRAARTRPHVDGAELIAACARSAGFDVLAEPPTSGKRRESWEAVRALVDLASRERLDAAELLAELQSRAKQAHCLTPGGVTLATIHAAKGLEWEAVWLVGASTGVMPSAYATTAGQLSEEQHLAYVAVSRAKAKFTVSWPQKRANGRLNIASPYIDMMTAGTHNNRRNRAHVALTRTTSPALSSPAHTSTVARCASCGDELRSAGARRTRTCSVKCLDSGRRQLYDQLVRWRQEQADADAEPVRNVASDRDLFTIAATGDTSLTPALASKPGLARLLAEQRRGAAEGAPPC